MPEFYYLLGAGASAEVIPTVRNFASSMKSNEFRQKIINIINQDKFRSTEIHSFVEIDFENELQTIKKIANEFENFGSPDIYAKYLFSNGLIKNLKELKHYLTLFIQFMEFFNKNGKPDQRYFEFIAQLIDGHKRFPKNIVIANWNYDNQFELAMKNFTNEFQWNSNLDGGHSGSGPYPPKYFEFKINGGAYFSKNMNNKFHLHKNIPTDLNDYSFMFDIMKNLNELKQSASGIKFAFENDPLVINKLIDKINTIKTSSNTTYLTIIGYSFPVFNREFDKIILNGLFDRGLRKIFIQDPNPEEIKRKIKGFFNESNKQNQIESSIETIAATSVSSGVDDRGLPIQKVLNTPFHIPMEFTPIY